MTKKKTPSDFASSSKKRPSTGSSVEKYLQQVPLISKDMPRTNEGVLSMLLGINLAQGHILKGLTVLQDKIENIAANLEILSKEVASMKAEPVQPEMNLENPSWLPSDLEIKEWLNMPILSPEHSSLVDLSCYETPFPSIHQWIDHQLEQGGSTDLQVLANQNELMKSSKKPISKNQEPSGGMDI